MRLAHFVQRYPPALGGSESYFARLGRFLNQRGHDVTVWTTNALDVSAFWSPRGRCCRSGESCEDGVVVRRYPLWRMRGRRWLLKPMSLVPLRAWQAMTFPCNPISFAMWRHAGHCTERYDAVHATAFPYAWPIICARRLARRLGVPFLLTPFLHVGDRDNAADQTRQQYTQPALRRLLLSADRVFVQTQLEYDVARELGVLRDRLVLQGLGVDPAECTGGDREAARRSWGVLDGDVVIGHLANLSVEKGTIDLVRAFERLSQDGNGGRRDGASPMTLPGREGLGEGFDARPFSPTAAIGWGQPRLILAGPAMPNYERFRLCRPTNPRIMELGQLTESAKRDFFAGIDLFALPSRSDSFGLVLLEAWANRKPVVVYRAGGPGELIRDGTDGLLARCGDIDELCNRMQLLVRNALARSDMGLAGQRRCESEFKWDDKLQIVEVEMIRAEQASHANDTALPTRPTRSKALLHL